MDRAVVQLLANIDVADVAKATEFYCNALGLRIGRRFGGGSVELLGASSAIYLLEKSPGSPAIKTSDPPLREYSRHWTPVHLDFVVPEIYAAVQRAVTAGARLEGEVRSAKWGRIAAFADPFGHGFCLIEFLGRGYDEIADQQSGGG